MKAHKIGHRDTDAKGSDDSLKHDKSRLADSIIKSGVAEKDCGKHTVNGICL